MRIKLVLLMITFALCAGCGAKKVQVQAPFDVEAHEAFKAEGDGVIAGQAFRRTRGGDVKYAAGATVYLIPGTAYGDAYYQIITDGKRTVPDYEKIDTRFESYVREIIGDGEGHFKFEDLPPGKYHIYTEIFWEYASSYGLQVTGGPVYHTLSLKPGEEADDIIMAF